MVYVFGDCELDEQRCELRRAGQAVNAIEPRMFDVLVYLIAHRDHVVSKEELHEQCWHGDAVTDGALVRCISVLRKALGDDREHRSMIKTVPRKGYIFLAPVAMHDVLAVASDVESINQANQELDPKALIEQLGSMIATTRSHSLIDAPEYLRMLRQEVSALQHSAENAQIVVWLKEQIKSFCISSETYFTHKVAQYEGSGDFLYACSSLVDAGYRSYVEDTGWLTLLRTMGQIARQRRGHFSRAFFVDLEPLRQCDFEALQQVIILHLKNQVQVALIDQASLPDDVRPKRNMAWLHGQMLIHATDQIQWDLDITDHKMAISQAREQHDFFVTHAAQVFTQRDTDHVRLILADLFPQSEN